MSEQRQEQSQFERLRQQPCRFCSIKHFGHCVTSAEAEIADLRAQLSALLVERDTAQQMIGRVAVILMGAGAHPDKSLDEAAQWVRGRVESLHGELVTLKEEVAHERHEKETVADLSASYQRWARRKFDELEASQASLLAKLKEMATRWHANAQMLAEGNKSEGYDEGAGMQQALATELDAAIAQAEAATPEPIKRGPVRGADTSIEDCRYCSKWGPCPDHQLGGKK